MPRVVHWLVLLVVASAGLTPGLSCLPSPQDAPPPIKVGDGLWAEQIVTGAEHPSALAFAPDGRVFYTEKNTGRVRVIVDSQLADEPFATVPVNYAGKRGLLGIALHPDFETHQRVYVFYTRSDTGAASNSPQAVIDNRVVYFAAEGNVAAGGEVFVASLPAAAGTGRVGGRIAFAPDGTLLVAIGDVTDAAGAQRFGTLVGKVLRYNDDGTIPDDNPMSGSPVYARGLRDPRGLTFDPTGDPSSPRPFLIDRQDSGRDEVNIVRAGGNYGWPSVSGLASTPEEQAFAAANADYVDPIIDTGQVNAGLVGGGFNSSGRYGPATHLHYFYGRTRTRSVMSAELTASRDALAGEARVFAHRFQGTITDVAFTPAGTLYVACDRAIFRIVPYP